MRLHDRIVQGLTEDIVLGDVAAGEWLPRELDLMDRHGVSRGVVREAIRALETRRLVEVRHGRGARVRPEAEWDLLDTGVLEAFLLRPDRTAMVAELLECRRLLEGQAAAQAAARATGEDVQALSDAHTALAAVTVASRRPSTAEAFVEAEADVHRVVVRLAGNRPLERMLAPLHPALATAIRDQPPERHAVLLDVLERLLEAIRTRDGDAARAAVDAQVALIADWLGSTT